MAKIKYSVIITILVMCMMSAVCSKRDPKVLHSSFHRAFSTGKNENSNSLLDTFSLSWSGNFDFSKTFEGTQKIFEGIFTFIDLKAIRAAVDTLFEMVSSSKPEIEIRRILHRSDQFVDELDYGMAEKQIEKLKEDKIKQKNFKEGLTTLLGALMQKQQCWEQCSCVIGSWMRNNPGKELFFMVAKNFIPSSWNETLKVVEEAANRNRVRSKLTSRIDKNNSNINDIELSCHYECDPNKDGRSFSYNK